MNQKDIPPPSARGYSDPSIFVTTEWLEQHLSDTSLVLVDCDTAEFFLNGHIPTAVNPYDNYYKTSLTDRTHVQTAEKFADTMRGMGISNTTLVVAYDRNGGLYSFRLAWVLRYYRHSSVKVLDGGYQKWVAEGRTLSTTPMHPPQGDFSERDPDISVYADKEDVLQAISGDDTVILDVRSPEERDGSNKREGKRGGYIPDSIYLEWSDFHTGGDIPYMRPAWEIKTLMEKAGVSDDKQVITYCQGGIRAAYAFWALRLSGFRMTQNYDASWREWNNDLSCPIKNMDAYQ